MEHTTQPLAPQGSMQSSPQSSPLALIAAGGEGKRLGAEGPKALVHCAGRSLLAWSLDCFMQASSFAGDGRVIVAAHASDFDAFEAQLAAAREGGLNVSLCAGGPSRSHSVRNALEAAGGLEAFNAVLVHDAARPLAGSALVDACVAGLEAGVDAGVEAIVPAAPVTDTIKQAGDDKTVGATLDRGTLWAVQTPQAFRPAALAAALKVDDAQLAAATDDASLVEAAGGCVKILPWLEPNPKVTTEADLELIAGMLNSRR